VAAVSERLRPTPWQWLRYAFGGGLPVELRPWVLQDLTGDRWVQRHVARTLTQWAPTLLLIALPGPLLLRASLPFLVLVGCLYVSVSYLEETRAHRLLKHGIPAEVGTRADAERREHRELVRGAELSLRRAAAKPGRDRSFRRW
jgi:hypothetical protein